MDSSSVKKEENSWIKIRNCWLFTRVDTRPALHSATRFVKGETKNLLKPS